MCESGAIVLDLFLFVVIASLLTNANGNNQIMAEFSKIVGSPLFIGNPRFLGVFWWRIVGSDPNALRLVGTKGTDGIIGRWS